MKNAIGIIIFPIFCLLLSFFVLITDPGFTYLLLDNPQSIGPTKQLAGYFFDLEEVPDVFNAEEQAHLADVKKVVQYSFVLLAVLILALVIFCMTGDWKKIIKGGTSLLLVLLFLAVIIPFDKLFTLFHQIIFPQGNWMFSVDSTLIQFYPNTFFMSYGAAIAVHAIVAAGILYYFVKLSQAGDKKTSSR